MKNIFIALLLAFSFGCSGPGENENAVEDYPFLIGIWAGEGQFMDKDLKQEIGSIWIEFEIFDDNSVVGQIGDANITDASLSKADYGFEVKGLLDAQIKKGSELDKDHAVILIVIPEDNDGNVNLSDANFHLKNNFIFDFTMRVGSVTLVKEE